MAGAKNLYHMLTDLLKHDYANYLAKGSTLNIFFLNFHATVTRLNIYMYVCVCMYE